MERHLSLFAEPHNVGAAEWGQLRTAYTDAMVEYRAASALIIARLASHVAPTQLELMREELAMRALAAAREEFVSAWLRVNAEY